MDASGMAGWAGLGLAAGACGARTGIPGGLLAIPVLGLCLDDPRAAVGIALALVLVQEAWGAAGGARDRLVDWRSAAALAAAALPGSLLGPFLLTGIPRGPFLLLLGTALAGMLLLPPWLRRKVSPSVLHLNPMDYGPPGARAVRRLTDAGGRSYRLQPRLAGPMALSALLGLSCGTLGVEGEMLLAAVLAPGVPPPLATPTARAALVLPAAVALLAHGAGGYVPWDAAALLGLGGLAGLSLAQAVSAGSRKV